MLIYIVFISFDGEIETLGMVENYDAAIAMLEDYEAECSEKGEFLEALNIRDLQCLERGYFVEMVQLKKESKYA